MSTILELESQAAMLMEVSHRAALNAEMLSHCRSLKTDDAAAIRLRQALQNLRLAEAYVERAIGERAPLTMLREAS